MNISPFQWLRRKAAEAVTLGVSDALAAVAPEGEDVPDLAGLRALLAASTPKQLAAAPDDETPKRRK